MCIDDSIGANSCGNAKIRGQFWPKNFPSNFQAKSLFYKMLSKIAKKLEININMLDYMLNNHNMHDRPL